LEIGMWCIVQIPHHLEGVSGVDWDALFSKRMK
nr:hypothetical protein [Tanacetum cinerariifolium]